MKELLVETADRTLRCVDIPALLGAGFDSLPVTLRLLCENHIRSGGDLPRLRRALEDRDRGGFEFTFRPNRLLMHDTTCTPALADIAGLRDTLKEAGGAPASLVPTLPVDVCVDHSVAVDAYAVRDAFQRNAQKEYARNSERYAFLKWASQTMDGVRVHPPGTGIMHTANLEQLASVLEIDENGFAHPDMLLGTDSHTPMINGIGVLAWGVGGLEAESVMFGQDVSLAMPRVVGVYLKGTLPDGTLATDLALSVTHRLRRLGVTGALVEFCGPGVSTLSADARAVVANMAPEYGASTGYFPVDAETIAYLGRTGRPAALCEAIRPVFEAMGLWFDPTQTPDFDQMVEIDLATLSPVIAGPRRPQDRCAPKQAAARIEDVIERPLSTQPAPPGAPGAVPDGAVGIAAVTSCTNTSDPSLLIAAGLLARRAFERGLRPAPWVKTSLAPGSASARQLLQRAGLDFYLSELGFDIVGHGCTTCIGNSGPLPDIIETALAEGKAICAVLSGNRNFPGRVHPKLDLGYLASPPMVLAYAIKGDIGGDILCDPLGHDAKGHPVSLPDIWPSAQEIAETLALGFRAEDIPKAFAAASKSNAWDQIPTPDTAQFPWDPASRYLRRPKFVSGSTASKLGQYHARPLMVLGDDITTDHISPAGWIAPESAAGTWLIENGGVRDNLNVYAAYRGNWEVMVRGLFTNKLVRNHLQDSLEPSETVLHDGRILPVYQAANELARTGQSGVIFAGERYGMGSSRDWAAKGVALLNVRAVIAKSFERIHRTNLIGMGLLPLQILSDFDPATAGINADDTVEVDLPEAELSAGLVIDVSLKKPDGLVQKIQCAAAVETQQEVALLQKGGVFSDILANSPGG